MRNEEKNRRPYAYIWYCYVKSNSDKNDKTLVDIGSGAGFPGIVLAIILKDRKISLKIKLIEKSQKKVKFLKKI